MAIGIDLDVKTAVVAGSTAGIGLAIARALAVAGAKVVVSGRDSAKVDEAVRSLGAILAVSRPIWIAPTGAPRWSQPRPTQTSSSATWGIRADPVVRTMRNVTRLRRLDDGQRVQRKALLVTMRDEWSHDHWGYWSLGGGYPDKMP